MTDQVDEQALVEAVRAGDPGAAESLYRELAPSIERFARALNPHQADDLVSEAFSRILRVIRNGGGPERNVAGYLASTVRHLHQDWQRRESRETPASNQPWVLDGMNAEDETVELVEVDYAREAMAGLPSRWREVLWLVEVEQLGISQIAERFDMTPAAMSSLIYRAREGLRRGYLDQHLPAAADLECQWTRERLSRHVRDALNPVAATQVDRHLADCDDCRRQHQLLVGVNDRLGARLWPLALVGFASFDPRIWPHSSSAGHAGDGAGAGSASGVAAGPLALATTAAVAIAASVATAIALLMNGVGSDSPEAEQGNVRADEAPRVLSPSSERPRATMPTPAPRAVDRLATAASELAAFLTDLPSAAPSSASDPQRPLDPLAEPAPADDEPGDEPKSGPGPDPDPEPPPAPLVLESLDSDPASLTMLSAEEGIWSVTWTPRPTASGGPGTIPLTATLDLPAELIGAEGIGVLAIDSPGWSCAMPPELPPFVPDLMNPPFLGASSPPLNCTLIWNTAAPPEPLVLRLLPTTLGDPPTGTIAFSSGALDTGPRAF